MSAVTPPDFTGYYDKNISEWIHSQKELAEELGKSAVATSVEQAQADYDDAVEELERSKSYLKDLEAYNSKYPNNAHPPAFIAKQKLRVGEAEVDKIYMKIRLLNTQSSELKKTAERSTDKTIGPAKDVGPSAFFGSKIKVKAGNLKTHRRKHRNGPASVSRRNRVRMSRR